MITAPPPVLDSVRPEHVRTRDPYFDNAKFLAVTLVVVGHAWEPLRGAGVGGRALAAAQLFIYTFHLPVFVLICGYFSRGFVRSRARTQKLAAAIVVPYVVFSVAYPLYAGALAGRHVGWDPLEPYYLTWFLPALLAWRLSVPLWHQLRHPIPVVAAIWSIAGFCTLPTALRAPQVLSFLPFFVLGFFLRPEHFALLRRRGARIAGSVVLLAGALVAYALATRLNFEWIYWRRSFDQLGVSSSTGLGFRLLALAAAATMTLAFLAVVPARRTRITRLGSATMYAYLLHGFVTLFLSYQTWYYRIYGWQALLVGVGSVALTALLTSGPIRRMFRFVVEPRLDWLFVRATP